MGKNRFVIKSSEKLKNFSDLEKVKFTFQHESVDCWEYVVIVFPNEIGFKRIIQKINDYFSYDELENINKN